MSTIEHVLADGDMPFQQIVDLITPLIPARGIQTEFGYTYDNGIWSITDATISGIWYEDDRGIPLSRYRFDISSRAFVAHEWASRAFALLSERTDLDLLWVTNLEHIQASRPTLAAA